MSVLYGLIIGVILYQKNNFLKMTWLFKNITIVDHVSTTLPSPVDMLIQEGRIIKIGRNLNYPQAEIIELEDLHVSIGWMDIGASHGDPGAEHREDLQSLRAVAAAGGFTALAPWADTDPCADHKAAIHYLLHGNETSPVEILPIASLSEKGEGKEMADLMDLHTAGAICFSDGMKPIKNAGLFYRSLNYLNAFSGTCIHFPMDFNLVAEGQIHEGKWSTMLGLPGIPDVAEDLMVKRDLSILNYTDSKLILWGISSKLALDTLLNEDKLNRSVFAAVPVFNLLFSDENVASFDTNFKMMPPLRSETDKQALRKAVLDGDIQIISSNHSPWELDHKNLEFPYAAFGSISLQHVFSCLRTHFQELSLSKLIEILAYHPRRILNVDTPVIMEGAPANLTFFSPHRQVIISKKANKSLSENSPLWNENMTGKVYGVYNKGKLSLFNDNLSV
jgi:dihydroorotase